MAAADQPVLILGAGINGAALARELALNGVPVCVVDTADIASGTTAYSSRLIHGGLRYLEHGEFDLVRESLTERTRWLQLAPDFVRPLRLFIPIQNRWGGFGSAVARFLGFKTSDAESSGQPHRGLYAIRAGLWLYDRYARDRSLPRHRVHRVNSPDAVPVDTKKYRWLCEYSDAQIPYPERFVVALLQDAKQAAAERGVSFEVLTHHRVVLDGRTALISAVDDSTRVVRSFEPAAIVNATGAWVDETLSALAVPSKPLIGGTKGSHFLTSDQGLRDTLAGRAIYGEAADGRPVFILPFGQQSLVGTTDEPYHGHPQDARATKAEIEYLVEAVNTILPDAGLADLEIDFHYCGVRPLPRVDSTKPAAITRRHWLEPNPICEVPLYSIIGGKLTTCRSLAEESAAVILERIGRKKIADSRERPLAGTLVEAVLNDDFTAEYPPAAQTSGMLPGTNVSYELVRQVIESEWVTRLADLVERRLMLLYHPRLTAQCLRALAEQLADAGRLPRDRIEEQTAAVAKYLWNRYAKQVIP